MIDISKFHSLIDGISYRAQKYPQGRACVFLSADVDDFTVSNETFHQDMKNCADGLASRGIKQGDIVLLALDHKYELLSCFWGAMCCGAIPSILTYCYPGSNVDKYIKKVERMAAKVKATAVITLTDLHAAASAALTQRGCLVFTDDEIFSGAGDRVLALPKLDLEQIAFMQFTSGTTSEPKAIQFSHRAVLEHVSVIDQIPNPFNRVYVSWLPFYHDMGLISHIRSLLDGSVQISMSPLYWLQQPVIFLKAIHKYRGDVAYMPNFAFDYCAKHIREEDLTGMDLSCLQVLGNGSESVSHESMNNFVKRFSPYGFRADALSVGYGMAENVVAISTSPIGKFPRVDWVSIAGLQQNRAIPVEKDSAGARAIVSCGCPYQGIDLAIVDDEWKRLSERKVGEIIIRSNTLFKGYYLDRENTAGAFRDGWFRTGDLGYFADGQLYVCDRKKDLIIIGGRNVHPQAIENIAARVFGEAAARCVAFGVNHQRLGTEIPVLVVERRLHLDDVEEQKLVRQVMQQIFDELEVTLADIRLVSKGWVVKTTSGKVSRNPSRKKYLDEKYDQQSYAEKLSLDNLTLEKIEIIIINLFERVIAVQGIEVNDDFIKRGGDSLSALRLFLEIEDRFGYEVSPTEFFQRPTAKHLATILYRHIVGRPTAEEQRLPTVERTERKLRPKIKDLLSGLLPGWLKGMLKRSRLRLWGRFYKLKISFLTWIYGQEWVHRIFYRDRVHVLKQFYSLLENPLQSEIEFIQCSLIFDGSIPIQKVLLNEAFLQDQKYWTLQVDMDSLVKAHQEGRGIIIVGRHFRFYQWLISPALKRLEVSIRNFAIIGRMEYFLSEKIKELSREEIQRLKLSIYVDQLMKGKNVLKRGGITLVLPDEIDGISRIYFLPIHGRMHGFRGGFAELAIETGASVIPVSISVEVSKRKITALFLDPLDVGKAEMSHADRIERLINQYAAYLKNEWSICPGIVPLRLKKNHIELPPHPGPGE